MRSSTNLAWPSEPFGAGQRPFGHDRPMLAAIGMAWEGFVPRPLWGCAVYLTIVTTTTLRLDGRHLNFGFEVLTPESGDEPTTFAMRMNERLVACRRRATIFAGHDLAPDLDRLGQFGTTRRLPGVEGMRWQWADRAVKGRGMARMIDTAYDLDEPKPRHGDRLALIDASACTALAAACEQAQLTGVAATDVSGLATVHGPTVERAALVRRAITRTLAVALIAARATARYDWRSPIDVDHVVTGAAWDLLAELGEALPEE